MTAREGDGRGYRLSETVKRAIRRMACCGRTISEIARAVGVSRSSVAKVVAIDLEQETKRDSKTDRD